jgi:retinol dehydrogenase 12
MLHPAVYGAYTEIFAGFSTDLSLNGGDQGCWIQPWGRKDVMRPDMVAEAGKGAAGLGGRLWEWCEGVTREFEGTEGAAS